MMLYTLALNFSAQEYSHCGHRRVLNYAEMVVLACTPKPYVFKG